MVSYFPPNQYIQMPQFVQLKENDAKALSQQVFHLLTGKECLYFLGFHFYQKLVVLLQQ